MALERGEFPRLERITLYDCDIGADGTNALATALRRAALPALASVELGGNVTLHDDIRDRVRDLACGARQRGRMLLLLGAESARCKAPARRFLTQDGDRAVMCRTLGFMLL